MKRTDSYDDYNETKSNRSQMGFLIVFLLIFVGVIIIIANISSQSSYPQKQQTKTSYKSSYDSSFISEDDKSIAITLAQELVKAELKAPSTASFPWSFDQYTVTKNGDKYTVKGYVDAQNSFGAKIRSNFETCFTFEKVGTKYKASKIYTIIK